MKPVYQRKVWRTGNQCKKHVIEIFCFGYRGKNENILDFGSRQFKIHLSDQLKTFEQKPI